MDVDDAVLEVDVFPLQRFKLTGASVRVDRHDHEPTPAERYFLACEAAFGSPGTSGNVQRCFDVPRA